MNERSSLVDFQRALTERLREAPSRQAFDALLGIALGDERWLLNLADIAEVAPCPPIEPVPWTNRWLLGATNFRGQVHGVVDLAAFVGAAPVIDHNAARLLLINRRLVRNCALLVPALLGMRNPAAFTELEVDRDMPWVKSLRVDAANQRWLELDLRRLAVHPTFLDVAR